MIVTHYITFECLDLVLEAIRSRGKGSGGDAMAWAGYESIGTSAPTVKSLSGLQDKGESGVGTVAASRLRSTLRVVVEVKRRQNPQRPVRSQLRVTMSQLLAEAGAGLQAEALQREEVEVVEASGRGRK